MMTKSNVIVLFLAMTIFPAVTMAATVTADKVSAPVVAADPPQPDSYTCTFTPAIGAAISKSIAPIKNTDGSVQLSQVLEPLLPAGTYTTACAAVKGTATTAFTPSTNQAVLTQTGVLKAPANVVIQ